MSYVQNHWVIADVSNFVISNSANFIFSSCKHRCLYIIFPFIGSLPHNKLCLSPLTNFAFGLYVLFSDDNFCSDITLADKRSPRQVRPLVCSHMISIYRMALTMEWLKQCTRITVSATCKTNKISHIGCISNVIVKLQIDSSNSDTYILEFRNY